MDFARMMQITNENNHFMIHNHMKLTQMWEDHAVVEMELHPDSLNMMGGLHGGAIITMADCAAGAAARSSGTQYVTLSNSFEFFATSEHDFVRAYASVRHRGKTICVIAVDVKDGEEKLLAGGTFTMYATGVWKDEA